MILVLVGAAVVSGLIGELSDTLAIVVIVLLNAVIGFIQEYRAEKALSALKKMAAPHATVMRGGMPADILSFGLVPGDVVVLEARKIVPADMRLPEVAQLMTEETALTGESVAVEKDMRALGVGEIPIGDRKNMVFKGTTVSFGRRRGLVVSTGMQTEIGKIAAMLQEEDEARTPLQKRLAAFGKKLAIVVIVLCAFIFGVGVVRGEQPLLMLLTAISLAIAAIPEAPPAVVTIALAIGANKMVKQNALIRKLPAVETLGSVTYICSDKTGTLTQNKMTVMELYADGELMKRGAPEEKDVDAPFPLAGGGVANLLMTAMALNNDVLSDSEGKVIGDPAEVALYVDARESGFDRERLARELPRISEIPFDSDWKCITTIHQISNGQGLDGSSERNDAACESPLPGIIGPVR